MKSRGTTKSSAATSETPTSSTTAFLLWATPPATSSDSHRCSVPSFSRSGLKWSASSTTSRSPQLESFLFGADRIALQPVRAPLLDLQHGACFYCGGPLKSTSDVDHFFPWSRYPDDRLDNLVVAHPACNRQKKDFLASADHLASWIQRLSDFDTDLDQIATAVDWPRNTARSLGVVRGTYLKLPDGVALWHKAKEFVPSRHQDLLEALAAVR